VVPDRANELIRVLAGLPVDDPSRSALRARAIEAWLPLARHLAGRYAGRGEPTADLAQTATIGLIKAIDRFEADRGVDFAGFAIPTILGEVRRHFRDHTWSVRPPRRLQELGHHISGASMTLTHELGRSPTVAEVAARLGAGEEEVLEGLEGGRAYNATSLSMPIGDGATELGDTLGGEDHDLARAEMRVALASALTCLDSRAQTIVALRFFSNLTQTEIGERIGISQIHVSRLLSRALATLRECLDEG
jgi:RNA polymerase sigma-B factor